MDAEERILLVFALCHQVFLVMKKNIKKIQISFGWILDVP